jgi:hypothetical protein
VSTSTSCEPDNCAGFDEPLQDAPMSSPHGLPANAPSMKTELLADPSRRLLDGPPCPLFGEMPQRGAALARVIRYAEAGVCTAKDAIRKAGIPCESSS